MCRRGWFQQPRCRSAALCQLLHLLELITDFDLFLRQLLAMEIRSYFLPDLPFAWPLPRTCLSVFHWHIYEHVHGLCTAAASVAFAILLCTRTLPGAIAVSLLITRWSTGIVGHRNRAFRGVCAFADSVSFLTCFTGKGASADSVRGRIKLLLRLRPLHSSILYFVTCGSSIRSIGRRLWRHYDAPRLAASPHLAFRPPKSHEIEPSKSGSTGRKVSKFSH